MASPGAAADADEDEEAWAQGAQAEVMATQPVGAELLDAGLRIYSMLDGQWHDVFVEAYNERNGSHRVKCEHYARVAHHLSHTTRRPASHVLYVCDADSDGLQQWHQLRDERWIKTSEPADRPQPPRPSKTGRPTRRAGELASRAAARLAAHEEVQAEDDDGGDDVEVEPPSAESENGDVDEEEYWRRRQPTSAPKRRASSGGGTGKRARQAGEAAARAEGHPRPRGRAPPGQVRTRVHTHAERCDVYTRDMVPGMDVHTHTHACNTHVHAYARTHTHTHARALLNLLLTDVGCARRHMGTTPSPGNGLRDHPRRCLWPTCPSSCPSTGRP